MNNLNTDILVVGGTIGGTCAAIQAARRGIKTILVSEFSWLGGTFTSGGVSAPDGNELIAFQTGLWGTFLEELKKRHSQGLDQGWVSFFNFDPRIGASIFSDWVKALPNLHWISGETPQKVLKDQQKITGVIFKDITIHAQIVLDGTELGDLLSLGEIPYRWGWEFQSEWGEPSAPISPNEFTENHPIQAPTWVVFMQDFGDSKKADSIPSLFDYDPQQFIGGWNGYAPEQFMNYGRISGGLLMINWPNKGNDYGHNLNRLIQSECERQTFFQECFEHSYNFVHFIQKKLGNRYGLAHDIFPLEHQAIKTPSSLQPFLSAFALHPYYRESRRLQGLTTLREQDILPISGGKVAPLPINSEGIFDGIVIGNYPNDHHYTLGNFPIESKSIKWGGRWTGTPFSVPYRCLIPQTINGFLVCEKNLSVSHIANGSTRLQPLIMNLGQAAGMAAALCIEKNCQPRDLSVRILQESLLQDPLAPAAIIPLFNLILDDAKWLMWQRYYLEHPEQYPVDGNCYSFHQNQKIFWRNDSLQKNISGIFHRHANQVYSLTLPEFDPIQPHEWTLVTLHPVIEQKLQNYPNNTPLTCRGKFNFSGQWFLVETL